jgi:hypothetical protein
MTKGEDPPAGGAGGGQDGSNGKNGATGGKEDTPATTPTVGPWHVVALGILMGALLIALALVIPKFNSDRDTVTGVLGVVIPAFATIGAAIFGVTVGYTAGKAQGESAGKAQGEVEKKAAVNDALSDLHSNVADAHEAMDAVLKNLTTNLESPKGQNAFVAPGGDAVIDTPQIARAREKLAAVMRATRPDR